MPERSKLLYPALRRLLEAASVEALYAELLSIGVSLSEADSGFAASVDREREVVEPFALHGRADKGPFSLEWGPAARAVEGTGVRVETVRLGAESLLPDVRSILHVPLRGPTGPYGMLCLGSVREEGFANVDHGAFAELAESTAHLLTRRVDQAEREEELSLLWDVKRGMVDPDLDLDEANLSALLAKILQIAMRRTRTKTGGIFLVDEETGDLIIEQQAVRGDYQGHLPDRFARRQDRASGIIFWVIEHNRPYRSGDVTHDPYYLPFFRSIRSNLTVPITFQDRAIGAIAVESVEPEFFTDADVLALGDLARSATMFIRRAQLYKHTRRGGRPGILIKGASPLWVEVEKRVERAAGTDATVLIRGESGSGKELLAHAIHFNSRRAKKPFVVVNAGAIPETLLETELFGHERGSFTGATRDKLGQFELADGGTMFLDEIGDLSPLLQVKLLRTLQSGEIHKVGSTDIARRVDVRVIAATNRDLEKMMKAGGFREDLYYRIHVVPIWLPPLRKYKRDSLPGMARAFVEELARAHRRPIQGISQEAMDVLLAYDWPGNVRELRNCLEQAVILEEARTITIESLPSDVRSGATHADVVTSTPELGNYHVTRAEWLRRFEESYVQDLLRRASGNISRAAEHAGISRVNLHRLLRKHNIRAAEFRSAGG